MVGIITSKTRKRFSAADKQKMRKEVGVMLREKHEVFDMKKTGGAATEEQIIDEIEKSGSKVRDMMQERRCRNNDKMDAKQKAFLKDQKAKSDALIRRKEKASKKKG